MIILAEDSLGWQNRLTDKASVRFRLTAEEVSYDMMLLFYKYGYNEKISFSYNGIRDIVSCMESFFILEGQKGESQWNIQEATKSNITDWLNHQVQPKTILFS